MLSKDWAELILKIVTELPVDSGGEDTKEAITYMLERVLRRADPTAIYERVGCLLSEDYCRSINGGVPTADPVIDVEQLNELGSTDYASALLDTAQYPGRSVDVEIDPDVLALEESVMANPFGDVDPAIVAEEEAVMADPGIDMTDSEMVPKFDSDLEKQLADAKASADANLKAFAEKNTQL